MISTENTASIKQTVNLGDQPNARYFMDIHTIGVVTALQSLGINTTGSCQGHHDNDIISARTLKPYIEVENESAGKLQLLQTIVNIFNEINPFDHRIEYKITPMVSELAFGKHLDNLLQAQLDLHIFGNLCNLLAVTDFNTLNRYLMLTDGSYDVLHAESFDIHAYHKRRLERKNNIKNLFYTFQRIADQPTIVDFINEGIGL